MKLYYHLKSLWDKHNYTKLVICCVLLLCAFITLCIFATTAFIALQGFMSRHIEPIMLSALGLAVIIYCIKERTEERQKARAEAERQAQELIALDNEAKRNTNYSVIRQCLFDVLADTAENIGLVKPKQLNEINSNNRHFPKGNIVVYQFFLTKQGDSVDIAGIRQILQNRIEQRLDESELNGITKKINVVNGQAFYILQIESISESGKLVIVNLAWATDAFCQRTFNRLTNNFERDSNPKQPPTDQDF